MDNWEEDMPQGLAPHQDTFQPADNGVAVGMSFDDVALLLASQLNGFQVGRNDPLMALVLINNAHLAEVQKLLARHNAALTQVMEHTTAATTRIIQEEARQVVKGLETSAITHVIATATEHQKAMTRFLFAVEALALSARGYAMMTIGASFASLLLLAVVLLWTR